MTSTVLALTPSSLSESEIQEFISMVRSGGEVGGAVLDENVRNAECLVTARQGTRLAAVAALKIPKMSYRKTIRSKSGIVVDADDFPFELGYLFVAPSVQKQGLGRELSITAISKTDGRGVFATARTNNKGMRKILLGLDFIKDGKPYVSGRGKHHLQLFLRPAAQQGAAAEGQPATRFVRS